MTQEEEINRILVEIEAIFGRVNADFDRIMVLLKKLTSEVEVKPNPLTETRLPPNDKAVRARYPGMCYECGLAILVGDWIVIQNVDGINAAIHTEHYLKEKYFPIRNLKEE